MHKTVLKRLLRQLWDSSGTALDEERPGPSRRTSFNSRLYPTQRQQRLLSEPLAEARWLWHPVLVERQQAGEERREAVDYCEQKAELPGLKADVRPGLRQAPSQVVQDVALRLKQAMDTFFCRLKTGEIPS